MPGPAGRANGSRSSAIRATAGVDPIDWIHRIPIEETREYVQKVLSNIQIYRARLGESQRGAPQRRPEARSTAAVEQGDCRELKQRRRQGYPFNSPAHGYCRHTVGQYALIGSPTVQPSRRATATSHGDADSAMQTWNDIYFSARDGLRLYARHYPVPGSPRRPVLCLAGLTRNSPRLPRSGDRTGAPG